jgi:TolB-like protein/DNA-binding winged helix-turn-helix (wHTH) protein/Tfp pilus assembly protein PilF
VSEELYKHGIRIKIQGQPLQVLAALLERPGDVVTRDELRQRIWDRDTYVDFDHSLNISINKLRDALGDSASTPRFIETLPRRGYRFLAPVSADAPIVQAVPIQAPPPADVEPAAPFAEPQDRAIESSQAPSTPMKRRSRIPLAVAVALLLVLAAVGLWTQRDRFSSSPHRVMLAVLPFEDLTGSTANDYFVEGLHDEMISQLGRLDPAHLGVIARTSVEPYAKTKKGIDQIGRDLHVDYVLDGAVRQGGGHFRITAALIKVSDQTQLWVETYEPKMGEILALQEDVAKKVSDALSMEFLPTSEQKLRENTTENAAAYEAYLKGRFLWYQETRQSLEGAILEFQRAIALDPNYAPAYVGLADSYNVLGGYGFVPADEAFPKGKAAAAKALALAPNLSDAYSSMAFAAFYYDWNWTEAEQLFRKALALNPNNQVAHEFYSSFLHAMGRLDEAEAENHAAQQLDPMSGWLHDDLGWMLLTRRRPEQAITQFQKATELSPEFPAGHLSLAVAYIRTKRYDKALAEVHRAEELGGDPTRVLEILGSLQAISGDLTGAQATVDKLRSGAIAGRVSPYSVALIYTAMGRKGDALDWLEKGYREKDTWIVWIKVLVEWQSLQSEPRYMALLQKLKLQ